MKDYNCNTTCGLSNNCGWIVLLVGAYFFLSNGCIGEIFDQSDNSIIWIIILFFFLFMYNNQSCR